MIERTEHGENVVLTLSNGRANALGTGMLEALRTAIEGETTDPPRGLILTGAGSMFSAGLDLLALENADEAQIGALGEALVEAMRAVFAFPRPTVAAINGHAIAGGALLALACDRRFVAAGKAKFGLTEAQLGLAIPPSLLEMLRYPLARPVLEQVVYTGAVFSVDEARSMGLVEDVVDSADLLDRSVAAIEEWTPSVPAFADVKGRLHAQTLERLDAARADDGLFVRNWFSDDAQASIRTQITALKG